MDTSTNSPPPVAPDSASERQLHGQKSPVASTSMPVPLLAGALPPPPPVEDTYTKRLLPNTLSSPYPHGLITGEPRTTEQQAVLDARKAEILATMTVEQIQDSYQETVKQVQAALQEIKDGNDKIDKEIADAKKTRETERRAWLGMKKAAAEGET